MGDFFLFFPMPPNPRIIEWNVDVGAIQFPDEN